jgi:hypothetical protein
MWMEKGEVEICSITADGSAMVNLQDEDFIDLPSGHRARLENPCVSPDGTFWMSEYTRYR